MSEKTKRAIKVVAENRKARFNYAIEDTLEAGISLTGTEVKSIRTGKGTIAESYADPRAGEIWLVNGADQGGGAQRDGSRRSAELGQRTSGRCRFKPIS